MNVRTGHSTRNPLGKIIVMLAQSKSLSHLAIRCCCVVVVLPISAIAQQQFYVSPTGSDTNPGTLNAPWQTIQHAADVVPPDSVVNVRGGIYNERITVHVSGTDAGHRIAFQPYQNEHPVIDGSGFTVPATETGLVLIIDHDWITIDGFEIRNYTTATKNRVPVGVHVRGSSSHITLRNLDVHHIETNWTGVNGGDAHGIAFYGDNASTPIDDVRVENCQLHDLLLGSSEALVFNGNVTNFTAAANTVHDCNNIAIVAIGFEGTSSNEATDQARFGLISENLVYNIDSRGNPAYGNDRSADGIYVDGGRDIVIDRNIVHHANIGIEMASEHANHATSNIIAINNFVSNCHIAGVSIGGYDTQRGYTEDCQIVNNSLYNNDTDETYSGELLIQYDARRCTIKNNIFKAGPQSVLISNPFTKVTNLVLDNNCFDAPSGASNATFIWKNHEYNSFNAYKNNTGNDANSQFANPKYMALGSSPDLHIQPTSPCRDAGDDAAVPPSSTLDIDNEARIVDAHVDQGADEYFVPGDCSADFNNDGLVNTQDVLAFLNAWNANDPSADFNNDGLINTQDVLAFLNAWTAGC